MTDIRQSINCLEDTMDSVLFRIQTLEDFVKCNAARIEAGLIGVEERNVKDMIKLANLTKELYVDVKEIQKVLKIDK